MINEHDYPPSPAYYIAPHEVQIDGRMTRLNVYHIIDAWRLDYWLGGAISHILRAGRKPGETERSAIANTWGLLVGWFRWQGWPLPPGRLNAELDELRAENARLGAELAALRPDGTPLESAPPTTATPADEWTDEELYAWCTAKWGEPVRIDYDRYRNCIVWPKVVYHPAEKDARVRWRLIHGVCPLASARGIARHFGATKPADPFADLLTIETDEGLRAWLDGRYKSRFINVVAGRRRWELTDDGEGGGVYFDPTGPTGPMSEHGDGKWSMTGSPPRNMTATEAARALHRILTEPAP